jgi:hypothetical protein
MSISSPHGQARGISERQGYKKVIAVNPGLGRAWNCEDDRKVIITAAGSFAAITVRPT